MIKPFILFFLLCLGTFYVSGQMKSAPKSLGDTIHPKIDSLQSVIVTATMRPKIIGDTVEYNTEHMQMQANAVVEELLRRLPGLHIDPDGTITYNGEKIQHIFIDGQDVFGLDPTMVTRNFDATKIAKVQLMDRKSDQSIFTGIEDGFRSKILNLVLKDNAKDGYFGKIEAGGNTNGYYNANSTVAAFQNREQFTALGLTSNTGILNFSGAGGASGSVNFLKGNTDALGASAGTGIPRFSAVAIQLLAKSQSALLRAPTDQIAKFLSSNTDVEKKMLATAQQRYRAR